MTDQHSKRDTHNADDIANKSIEEPELNEEELDSYIISTPDRMSKKPESRTSKKTNRPTDPSTPEQKQDKSTHNDSKTSKKERNPTNRVNKRTPTRPSRSPERLGAFGMHARCLRKGLASPLKSKAWAQEVSEKWEYQAEDFEAWRDCELDW